MRLLLVRHGETVGNVERRMQGADDPLTDRGLRQARDLAAHLAERGGMTALYTSPLPRAMHTAQVIGEALGLTPVPRDALVEISVGDAAGYRFEEWTARFPDEARRFHTEGVDYAWPGGESGRQVGERTAAEINRILQAHSGETESVVVISHGGALAWIIAHLLHESRDRWPQEHLGLDNCSLTEVEITGDSREAVTFLCRNEVGHLSPEPDAEVATGQAP